LRSVPYRFPAYDTCSRNSPASTRRANSASSRKWYSRPSRSSGRRGRVVADVATSSSGSAARARAMRVPLPTPEGPATTNRRLLTATPSGWRSGPEEVEQLAALAIRETADGLALADPALRQQARRLHAPEPRHRDQHVVDLCRQHLVRRLGDQVADPHPSRLEVALQLRPPHPYVVRPVERLHALIERSRRRLGEGAGCHGRGRLYPWEGGVQPRENPIKRGNLRPERSSSS